MNHNDLQRAYFDWMYRLAISEMESDSYRELLYFLDRVTFVPVLRMDENRAQDGEDLRYRFGYENRHLDSEIGPLLDCRPCSILEMMVALCLRMDAMMFTPVQDIRTSYWFKEMLTSLRLSHMTDDRFDLSIAEKAISRFLSRRYAKNGRGGLFTISSPNRDMRTAEIWYQMNWYLDEVYYQQ